MIPPFSSSTFAPPVQSDDGLLAAIRRMAIVSADTPLRLAPMDGGVSSDIYRVDAAEKTFCVKRALPKLKVSSDWRAPVSRNRSEVAWLRRVSALLPANAPAILGDDAESGTFAMEWLAPEDYPTWKTQLRDGRIDRRAAAAVGNALGRIHAATADQPDIEREFAHDDIFVPIRLDPYLLATGRAHPALAGAMESLVAQTLSHKHVLVHGDYSPKNILIGTSSPRGATSLGLSSSPQKRGPSVVTETSSPRNRGPSGGPVILDAECACYGDPAFDLAFVANHLLLKGIWRPAWREDYLGALRALVAAYRAHVDWEPWDQLDRRIAALLPALLLARIDGKSPVEYITREDERDQVRTFAIPRIETPPDSFDAIAGDWSRT